VEGDGFFEVWVHDGRKYSQAAAPRYSLISPWTCRAICSWVASQTPGLPFM
jgi:hypothetical protein